MTPYKVVLYSLRVLAFYTFVIVMIAYIGQELAR